MHPITFPSVRELNSAGLGIDNCEQVTFAKDQPEYLQLPALRIFNEQGQIVSRWKLNWRERLTVLFTGEFFLSQLTFNQPLQPIKPHCTLREGFAEDSVNAD